METGVDREWVLFELRQSLRALAAPREVALAAEPAGTVKADELALDYDNFALGALSNFGHEFTPEQSAVIRSVNAALGAMSGESNSGLWTEDAVLRHPAWEKVRALAQKALETLGWEGAPLTWEEYRAKWAKIGHQ